MLEYDVTKKIIESKYIKEINKDNELLNNNNATNNNATDNNEKNGILEQYYIKINNLYI